MNAYETEDLRWDAVRRRDRSADGAFIVAVRTTRIYCRPHCPSRPPLRENVRFYPDWSSAERDGYRACKRCTPREGDPRDLTAALIDAACRRIAIAEIEPSLADLAAAAGFSRFHFHRLFRERIGLTPKQYAKAHRVARLQDSLPKHRRVADALYDAGYGSSRRAYDDSARALGMTPGRYRDGGDGEHIGFATTPMKLGWILVAATERGVCAIELGDDPNVLEASLRMRFPRADVVAETAGLGPALAAVVAAAEGAPLDLPLDLRGTAFQLRVWEALRRIPPGERATYREIAASLGAPSGARAVAAACAANPVALAVPCHRVVRSDGSLSGYRWGAGRKRALLEAESARR